MKQTALFLKFDGPRRGAFSKCSLATQLRHRRNSRRTVHEPSCVVIISSDNDNTVAFLGPDIYFDICNIRSIYKYNMTTNLGVRSSNLFGRATFLRIFKRLVRTAAQIRAGRGRRSRPVPTSNRPRTAEARESGEMRERASAPRPLARSGWRSAWGGKPDRLVGAGFHARRWGRPSAPGNEPSRSTARDDRPPGSRQRVTPQRASDRAHRGRRRAGASVRPTA